MIDIGQIADSAKMIVSGCAFSNIHDGEWIRVLNLNNPEKAVVLSFDNKVIETTMDDIEIQIVKDYLFDNKEFMEE